MGFVTIGIFVANQQGVEGAIFQMLSHGVVSAALFLIVGVIYDRLHTRLIVRYDGLVNRMPGYALIFMLFMLASVGLPGTSGFVGEFLVLIGAFQVNTWVRSEELQSLMRISYAVFCLKKKTTSTLNHN